MATNAQRRTHPVAFEPKVRAQESTFLIHAPVTMLLRHLHKTLVRNPSAAPLDMADLKQDLKQAFKAKQLTKSRYKSYLSLVNAIEKLVHDYTTSVAWTEVPRHWTEALWLHLEADVKALHRQHKPASDAEQALVDRIFYMVDWLRMFRDRQRRLAASCIAHTAAGSCNADKLCVWRTGLWQRGCRLKASLLRTQASACRDLRTEAACGLKQDDGCVWDRKRCVYRPLRLPQAWSLGLDQEQPGPSRRPSAADSFLFEDLVSARPAPSPSATSTATDRAAEQKRGSAEDLYDERNWGDVRHGPMDRLYDQPWAEAPKRQKTRTPPPTGHADKQEKRGSAEDLYERNWGEVRHGTMDRLYDQPWAGAGAPKRQKTRPPPPGPGELYDQWACHELDHKPAECVLRSGCEYDANKQKCTQTHKSAVPEILQCAQGGNRNRAACEKMPRCAYVEAEEACIPKRKLNRASESSKVPK